VRQRATSPAHSEDAWRAARWSFLRRVATSFGAVVATAHTRDDQIETVLMRVLRGSGARGLAALTASNAGIVRPLLGLSREQVAAYARERELAWVEDPSNQSRAHLRNRVRLDLLPALCRARPALARELLEVAERATTLRAEVEEFVANRLAARIEEDELVVARASLGGYDAPELAVLWPALAGGVGLALDRRGTMRLTAFTKDAQSGQRIQLSGGFEVVCNRNELRLRRGRVLQADLAQPLRDGVAVGPFRFRVVAREGSRDAWHAELPADRPLTARPWHPGDRMTPAGATGPRRVKRLLREAGIDAGARRGWPVVLAGEEIVWVPGVRRGVAATARSGRPVQRVACERILGR
jgi:tRNA(Ile)-lysidine synthase